MTMKTFSKCTSSRRMKDGTLRIKCRLGLWSVEGKDHASVQREAMNYWMTLSAGMMRVIAPEPAKPLLRHPKPIWHNADMKTLPKSMQPPEVVGTSSGVQGFDEFEQWASRNLPIWNRARSYGAGCFEHHREYLKLVAYALVLENRELKDMLIKHAENTATHTFPSR